MRIKFTFTNFPGEGPLIECDGYTHRAADYYAGAACNAHRDIASMAMLSLGKSPASPEAVKLAMLTAVDHLREQIDAAHIVQESGS